MPENQRKPGAMDFLLDDEERITDDDRLALDAELAPEPPPPEPAPTKPEPAKPAPPDEAAAKPAEQPPEAPRHEQTVPYERLVQENKKRKDAESKLAAVLEERARLDERIRIAREAEQRMDEQRRASTPPPEAPSKLGPKPDPNIDPIGADMWEIRRENEVLRHQQEQFQSQLGQTGQQIEAQRQEQEFANWVHNDVQNFRTQNTDYDAVTKHAHAWRVDYWKRLGMSEQQAQAVVDNEVRATAWMARQSGVSAAEQFYNLGKALGYQNGNGAGAPAPATAAVPEVVQSQPAKDRLNQVAKAQRMQGLGRVPADEPSNVDWSNLDAAAIAAIPEDEFAALANDPVRGAQLRRAMERLELGGA